jgi:TonB-linked SusC/RagA family outer membrane protein
MKYFLSCLIIILFSSLALAQDRTVRGTVIASDEDTPLPGVNVLIKGTTQGTVTDVDGNYSIAVPSQDAVLVYSSVGYESQEVAVGSRSRVDISLDPDLQSLEEVVVVGYGTMTKRDVTGSISSVGGEEISEVPVASFDQALQGRAAGVQVSQASGKPGAGTRILVRGTSSISAGSDPLFVVDGFPITVDGGVSAGINPFTIINPNDIESIDILKDAAATAIYGSRGANGVILITTKSGKQGAGEINLNYQRGVTSASNMVDLVGASDWLDVVDQGWANDGFNTVWDPIVSNSNLLSEDAFADPNNPFHLNRDAIESYLSSNPEGTNWLDPFWQNGAIEQISLSASRGFEKGNLYVSGQYRSEEGLVEGIRLDRYVVRSKIDLQPAENFSTGLNLNLSYLDETDMPLGETGGQRNGGRNDAGRVPNYGAAIFGTPPILPMFTNDGRIFDPIGRRNTQLSTLGIYEDVATDYRIIGNLYLQYDIAPFLNVRVEGAMDYDSFRSKEWASNVVRPSFYSRESNVTRWNRNVNAYMTFNNTYGDHNINAVVGVERQQRGTPYRNALGAENLISSDRNIGEVNNFGEDVLVFLSGSDQEFRIFSLFGRANYSFKDRYLLSASFRRDGASVFGERNRYGTFPAVSAGWIITEEDFAQSLSAVSFLKLRASFGQTGNPNLPGLVIQDGYTGWPAYGSGGGIVLTRLGNPSITWENIQTTDASLEFGLWQNRVSGSVGVYRQDVKDMLLQVPIPESQGILFGSSSIFENFGQLRNQGLELQLTSVNFDNGDFKWTTSLNYTSLTNEIIRLDEALGLTDNRLGVTNSQTVTRKGGRLAAYYLAEYAGVDPATGYDMIYEIDRDLFLETGQTVKSGNIVTATQQNVVENRIVHEDKTGLPTFFGGINNTFNYKGLSLSAQLTFQGGNYLFNNIEISQTSPGGGTLREDYIGNYWTPENRNAIYPRPSLASITRDGQSLSREHTRYLYKGDFARLNFVQLAYDFPAELLGNVGLKGLRVFVSANNLYTFTSYNGYDPEVVRGGDEQTRNLGQGFVSGVRYPQIRTFMGGINIKF